MTTDPAAAVDSRRARLVEIARLFLRLGFTAFGGPAAHVAMIEDEVVVRRKWVDRQHFLDLLAAVNFIPGPNSTELAIHLGLIRAGYGGMVVAGACFIVPAVLIILPLAWLYVRFGQTPQVRPILGAISAAVLAIVAAAVVRFARSSIKSWKTAAISAGALALTIALQHEHRVPPEILVLLASAIAGMIGRGFRIRSMTNPVSLRSVAPVPLLLGAAASAGIGSNILAMCLLFLRIGATLFGSGYVLVSYLHAGLVERRHWMNEQQLLDAIAVGQVTPGPLLTTATFAGYFLGDRVFGGGTSYGVLCAILATIAIFLPSFIFVAMLAPLLDRLRKSPAARGALDGMNAGVVALIAVVAWQLAAAALFDAGAARIHVVHVVIALGSLTLLLTTRVNATWLVVGAAVVGMLIDH